MSQHETSEQGELVLARYETAVLAMHVCRSSPSKPATATANANATERSERSGSQAPSQAGGMAAPFPDFATVATDPAPDRRRLGTAIRIASIPMARFLHPSIPPSLFGVPGVPYKPIVPNRELHQRNS